MYRLNVIIYQSHPAQQISLHQACNAQGIFNVRIADTLAIATSLLCSQHAPDLLIVDHAIPSADGKALLRHLGATCPSTALLMIGQPGPTQLDIAQQARQKGLWVVNELAWPLSMPALQRTLQRVGGSRYKPAASDFQTVMMRAHAH
nr:response regulator [uncultured Pseudomonas sp.]